MQAPLSAGFAPPWASMVYAVLSSWIMSSGREDEFAGFDSKYPDP
jgi:hypothetical protein